MGDPTCEPTDGFHLLRLDQLRESALTLRHLFLQAPVGDIQCVPACLRFPKAFAKGDRASVQHNGNHQEDGRAESRIAQEFDRLALLSDIHSYPQPKGRGDAQEHQPQGHTPHRQRSNRHPDGQDRLLEPLPTKTCDQVGGNHCRCEHCQQRMGGWPEFPFAHEHQAQCGDGTDGQAEHHAGDFTRPPRDIHQQRPIAPSGRREHRQQEGNQLKHRRITSIHRIDYRHIPHPVQHASPSLQAPGPRTYRRHQDVVFHSAYSPRFTD
ncbi:hypothetical protein D3C81_1128990 [compost metagenome]